MLPRGEPRRRRPQVADFATTWSPLRAGETTDTPSTPGARAAKLERETAWPALLACTYAVLIFVAGLFLHRVVVLGTNEVDNYVGLGRNLADGIWSYDVFHPLLYPALIAVVGSVLGDFFVAGKLVTAAAAGLLLWCVHRLGARVLPGRAALLAMGLVAVHPYVLENAFLVTDNMLSTALATATVLACVRLYERPSAKRAILTGLLCGVAYWSRYANMALAAPVCAVLLLQPNRDWRSRFVQAAAFAAALLVALTPHFVMSHAQFGKPLYDENWRNLALRHIYDCDWNRLFQMPFHGWWDVISHAPGKILSDSIVLLGGLFGHDLAGHLTGRGAADVTWPEWCMYGCAVATVLWSCLRRDLRLAIACTFPLTYLAALVVTFFDWPRQVLLGLPVLLVAVGGAIVPLERLQRVLPRAGIAAQLLLSAAILGYVAWPSVGTLERLHDHQTTDEVAVVRQLAQEHGPQTAIYLPYIACVLMAHADFEPRQSVFVVEPFDRTEFLRKLQGLALTGNPSLRTRFFVLSPLLIGTQDRFDRFASGPWPAPLEVYHRSEGMLVLEARIDTPTVPTIRMEPNPFADGEVHVSVFVAEPPEGLTHMALQARLPDGTSHVLPLNFSEAGCAWHRFELASLPRGTWTVTPLAVTRTGVIAGEPLDWLVR